MLSLLILLVLTLTNYMEVKGVDTSDFTFNSGVRYSQWVTKSRIGSYTANTTKNGFAVYDAQGNKLSGRTDGKSELDYVPGLVAKAIIENVQYYSQYPWAQSWSLPFFYSIADYGNAFYNKYKSTYGSLDDLNAAKVFFGLYELTNTGGAYASNNVVTSASTTKAHAQEALRRAMEGENGNEGIIKHNSDRRIENNTPAYLAGHTIVEGGWWHKTAYANEMWLDGSYMGPALFAQLHNYNGSDIIGDDWTIVYRQIQALWEMCWNSTDKLLYHAFSAKSKDNYSATWAGFDPDNGVYHSASYWGRACGWYFLALIDILEQMDKAGLSNTTNYATLQSHLSDLAAGLAARQDATTGCWYQLLDEDGTFHTSTYNNGENHSDTYNYIESSASALFTAGYLKAMRLGYLSGSTVPTGCSKNYETIAKDGYKGLVNNFFAIDGNEGVHIFGSCRSAGLGNTTAGNEKYRDGSKEYYLLGYDVTREPKASNITNRVTEGKALGGFILAATEYERQYQNNTVLFEKDLAPSYELEAGDEISCPASGSGANITYQWYKDDEEVDGATNATIAPTASGAYYCKATSGTTTITSSTAQVTVAGDDTFTPEFTTNLASTATATEGVAKTLTVAADHVDGYQWYSNTTASNTGGQAISGATSASYTFTPNATGTLYYYCVATNSKATGTQSVASAVCTVTVSEAPDMWTTAAATYNSTSKGYEVSGLGTYYKSTSGGETTKTTDNNATWVAGKDYFETSNSLFIYAPASSVSALKVYMRGNGNRTLSSVATASSLNGSYTTLTNNTDYTYSSTCTNTSYITTSSTYDVVTFTFTSALAAGTFIKITVSGGKAFIYGIEPVTSSGSNTYTVSYNMNGHGTAIADVTGATALPSTLPTPEATGYTFGGWYTNSGLISAATAGASISADTELYAKWTANTYSVHFDANGGEGSMTNESFTYGIEKALTANAFTRTGYKFDGWATSANGAKVYDDEESVSNLTATNGGTVDLYAKWTENQTPTTNYTVKFYNGDTQFGETQEIEEGNTVSAPTTNPTKDGYTFKGWTTTEGGTLRVVFPYPVYSNVNFYAVWSNTTSGGGGEDETIFSAVPTTRTSITESSTVEITSDNATITGGKLYAKNADTSDKNMINTSNSRMCYNLTNGNSCFKVELSNNKVLQTGDQISVIYYFSGNSTKNMWLSSTSTRPSSAPSTKMSGTKTSSDKSFKAITYTVAANDGICGQSEFYIFREDNSSVYFTDITITREGQAVGNDITLDATTDYENFNDYVGENKNVTLKRSFTEGKWTTLVLPFSVTTEQLNAAFTYASECEIAKIKSMNVTQGNGSIHYTTVSSIEANKPVLAKIKPNANGEYVFNGVTVVAPTSVVSTSTDKNVEMHGVYKTTGYTQINDGAYFLSGGKFYDWSYLNAMSPFSAYILPVGANAQSIKSISFAEDATGINETLRYENETLRYENSYNLAGQKVNENYNGIVIIKGKKVFTK